MIVDLHSEKTTSIKCTVVFLGHDKKSRLESPSFLSAEHLPHFFDCVSGKSWLNLLGFHLFFQSEFNVKAAQCLVFVE